MAFIRVVLRIAGFLLLAGAFVVFVIDGTRVIAGGPLAATPLGHAVAGIDPAFAATLAGGAWRGGASWLWDPLVAALLGAPAFAVLTILGVALMLLGRRFATRAWRT